MRKINIDLNKIPEDKVRSVGKGAYVDLIEIEYKNGRDDKGWDGMVALDVTKAERESGKRGAIIGNWKELNSGGGQSQQRQPTRSYQRPSGRPDVPADDNIDF